MYDPNLNEWIAVPEFDGGRAQLQYELQHPSSFNSNWGLQGKMNVMLWCGATAEVWNQIITTHHPSSLFIVISM